MDKVRCRLFVTTVWLVLLGLFWPINNVVDASWILPAATVRRRLICDDNVGRSSKWIKNQAHLQGKISNYCYPSSLQKLQAVEFFDNLDGVANVVVPLAFALGVGITAQTFINNMMEGDQGLGAYLRDGRGYNKSGFKPGQQGAVSGDDPLPWLSLPDLDFVEVAGQRSSDVEKELEALRVEMMDCVEEGRLDEAKKLQDQLETKMEEAGFEFTPE